VNDLDPIALSQDSDTQLRLIPEQALARTGGAPLIAGNAVRILKDSTENYPAWMDAIERARRFVLFENYIIANDEIGRQFIAILAAKARQGVRVRVIYDFGGSLVSSRLFAPLVAAGGEVRCFNPPRLDSPLGWLMRDHRKMIAVDGEVAFITGLCVARRWMGNAARGIAPWRDTGVEVRGPAVAEIERAFAQVWKAAGSAIPEEELTARDAIASSGDVTVMVIATEPTSAGLYRLDQFIATVARETLWLTDAYYVGTPAYTEALRAAARDGVDVRLLVPGSSDLPITQAFSRAGYRPLLEGGIRVFEWNGSMLHAKTAVADGRWSRVGSSNLNLSSWLANYELDLAVYDEGFGSEMDEMYLADLKQATEIVLNQRNRVRPVEGGRAPQRNPVRGSAGRAAAGALRIRNTVSAALSNRRILGPSEAGLMRNAGVVLLVLAILGIAWPWAIAVPVGLFAGWIGVALLLKAWNLRRAGEQQATNARPGGEERRG